MSNLKEISKLNTTININKNEKLIKAAKHDDLELTQTLLKNNANINHINDFGDDALRMAAKNGHTEVVNTLLATNSKIINHKNWISNTALI
ncbi:MAG: ankyrin repeat domain-containing protein, partial [Spiroplasma sp. WSS]